MNTEIFYPQSGIISEPWLLHASGFNEQKRLPDIIHAFARLLRSCPEEKLQIVGDGVNRRKMETMARETLSEGSYLFHGFLTKPELADLMRRSRGFIFPSSFETFGCVLMEAMACECPVLTTRVGGIPSVVRDGEGLFVEVGDIEGIADGMLLLIDGTHNLNMKKISLDTRERFNRKAVGKILHQAHIDAISGC